MKGVDHESIQLLSWAWSSSVIIATFGGVVKYIDQGGACPRLVATPGCFAAVISTALVPVAATKAAVQAA